MRRNGRVFSAALVSTAACSALTLAAVSAGAEPALAATIAEFQAEELEHHATAIAEGAERAPGYPLLSAAIRLGCRAAIGLSKRI